MTELDTVRAQIASLEAVESPGEALRKARTRRLELEAIERRERALALARRQMPDYDDALGDARATLATAEARLAELTDAATVSGTIGKLTRGWIDTSGNLDVTLAERQRNRAKAHVRRLERWPSLLVQAADARTIERVRPSEPAEELVPYSPRPRLRDRVRDVVA